MGLIQELDLGVLKSRETWSAFGIAVLLFGVIAYAGLSIFDLSSTLFAEGGEPEPVPDLIIPTLNRTGIEDGITNATGVFQLSEHRGSIVILDFMAHDCTSCHAVQAHVEAEMDGWMSLADRHGRELLIIGVGSWYYESLAYLNTSSPPDDANPYTVPRYAVGLGNETAAVLEDGSLIDPVRYFTTGGTGQIPVILVIDGEGYPIARESSGIPTDEWEAFDGAVETALTGDVAAIEDLRIGLRSASSSLWGIVVLGLMLSVLVYFSPCAFPVLPGFISYYLSLGAREEELLESGVISRPMPNALVIGGLSGLGMWTFFLLIGAVAAVMGEAFAASGIIHLIALGIALLLIVLGTLMLLGVTSHLMGWVQTLVDRWSTDESDDVFTPRRNMYLYGIGYAAASIDCTAAAVLPFVIYLSTLNGPAIPFGLGALMLGLLVLMIMVTVIVSMGRQSMVGFLRRATGTIKLVGSWMMIFAGIGLSIFLTRPDLVNLVFS